MLSFEPSANATIHSNLLRRGRTRRGRDLYSAIPRLGRQRLLRLVLHGEHLRLPGLVLSGRLAGFASSSALMPSRLACIAA